MTKSNIKTTPVYKGEKKDEKFNRRIERLKAKRDRFQGYAGYYGRKAEELDLEINRLLNL